MTWKQFELRGIEGDIDINALAKAVLALFPTAGSMKVEKLPEEIIVWLDLDAYKLPEYYFHMSDSREQMVHLEHLDILRIHYAI